MNRSIETVREREKEKKNMKKVSRQKGVGLVPKMQIPHRQCLRFESAAPIGLIAAIGLIGWPRTIVDRIHFTCRFN